MVSNGKEVTVKEGPDETTADPAVKGSESEKKVAKEVSNSLVKDVGPSMLEDINPGGELGGESDQTLAGIVKPDESKTAAIFISPPTVMFTVNNLNSKPLAKWAKLCKLKPAHTAEINKQILSRHLTLVSENKCILPPLMIETLQRSSKMKLFAKNLIH